MLNPIWDKVITEKGHENSQLLHNCIILPQLPPILPIPVGLFLKFITTTILKF